MGDPGSFGTRWGWAPWDSSLPRSWDSREFLPSLPSSLALFEIESRISVSLVLFLSLQNLQLRLQHSQQGAARVVASIF